MSIRLNKAIRELNIGLNTAVEFLEKRPQLGEVKSDPSIKISDEQYDALAKAFGKDANSKHSKGIFRASTKEQSETAVHSIGVQNFRRFQNLTKINLGAINMFVGGNNAGKSTLVKALLLIMDFLRNTIVTNTSNLESPKFYFNNEFVNIDTYNRAKCWNDKNDEDLVLSTAIEKFDICIHLFKKTDGDEFYGDVKLIEIQDNETGINFTFNVCSQYVELSIGSNTTFDESQIEQLKIQKNLLQESLKLSEIRLSEGFTQGTKQQDIAAILSHIADTKNKIKEITNSIESMASRNSMEKIRVPLSPSLKFIGRNYISGYIETLVDAINAQDAIPTVDFKELTKLKIYSNSLRQIASRFETAIRKVNLEYIQANSSVQKVLFNKKDNNDYLSQCICELHTLKITSVSNIGEVMKGWLKEFVDITDYKVVPACGFVKNTSTKNKTTIIGQGEGYAFGVKVGEQWHNLGDMGRGTIQLVTLFIHLAIILKKYRGSTINPIVLVEEPEQNLHPAVQTKLATLFAELHDKYSLTFIIETHSEYLIRKTQVIVADKKNNILYVNPFKVYFFPQKEPPYELEYRKDGKFANEFGTGFFDEASNLAFEIF